MTYCHPTLGLLQPNLDIEIVCGPCTYMKFLQDRAGDSSCNSTRREQRVKPIPSRDAGRQARTLKAHRRARPTNPLSLRRSFSVHLGELLADMMLLQKGPVCSAYTRLHLT